MHGGGEPGIIQRWLDIAGAESDHRRRDELGYLALVMAELKPWFGEWQRAMKEWNMRESTVIQGWIDLGELERAKKILRDVVQDRFGTLSTDLAARIDTSEDANRLHQAVRQVWQVTRPEDLLL